MSTLYRICWVGLVVCSIGVLLTGCKGTPPESPWESVPTMDAVPRSLSGEWHLVRLGQTGAEPMPNERKVLTIRADGVAYLDLMDQRLTYDFVIWADSHISLSEVASTNPNDKLGQIFTWPYSLQDGELTLNGDVYQRGAMPTTEPTLSPPATESYAARLNEPFTLKIGQSVLLQDTPDEFGVVFQSVNMDSRCPKQALCASSGEAVVQIGFLRGVVLLPQTVELTTNNVSEHTKVVFEGYEIQLIEVSPYPELEFAGKEITPGDYQATFVVTQATATQVPDEPVTPPVETSAITARLDEPFTLKVGQSAMIEDTPDGVGVYFQSVTADSRCPKQMECFWMGEARLTIGFLRSDTRLTPLYELTTNASVGTTKVVFEGYEFQLLEVAPYPERDAASTEITPGDYLATFVVTQAVPTPSPTP